MKRFHVLYRDATRLERSLDPAELRRTFNRDISMLIGALARRRVFVHAGVVGIDGKAVLVPGRSFSGKTTLVQTLVQQGAVYYSDEYAVLDSRGRVWPWAESLSIRAHGPAKPGDLRSPESLGAVAGKRALPVRLVVLTSFEEGRSFKPRTVSPAAGTLGLLQHTLPARRRPRRSLQALASVVSEARVVRGRRGDAHQAARVIVRMLANSRRP
jgi:serine kinase of HPr protein (carbohydrate metabolism regulator)